MTAVVMACWCVLLVAAQDEAEQDATALEEQLIERLEEARERLGLTDEQDEQVRSIMAAAVKAQAAVLTEHGIDLLGVARPRLNLRQLRALSADLDAVRAGTLEELAEVLTPEQLETYRDIQEEWRQDLRDRLRERRTAVIT